jgi:hypothetical protein
MGWRAEAQTGPRHARRGPGTGSTGGPPTSTATSLKRAYLAVGWRDADGNGSWTWHSLRHVFCTTALFTWKLDVTDVSRMAGHANYRITLAMYVGSTAGVLDRARIATESACARGSPGHVRGRLRTVGADTALHGVNGLFARALARRSGGSVRRVIWRMNDFGGCQTLRSSNDQA